jgi:hypothetical protein
MRSDAAADLHSTGIGHESIQGLEAIARAELDDMATGELVLFVKLSKILSGMGGSKISFE